MNPLITRIAQSAGIGEALAERAVRIILAFLDREGPSDKVRAMADTIPGGPEILATAAVEQPAQERSKGFMNAVGGLMGGGGAMAALGELTAAGLDMDQIQAVTREFIAIGREHAGDDLVGEVVGSIPGLKQFV